MKKNIFIYLFIVALVGLLYVWMLQEKAKKEHQKTIEKYTTELQQKKDTINTLLDANHFAIENNGDAQEYFYNNNLEYTAVIQKINEEIASLNSSKNGNPLVPYDPINGRVFLINKAKILNHRWIIAEFSNGKIWGEVLIKYFVSADKPTDFETIETVLYQNLSVN